MPNPDGKDFYCTHTTNCQHNNLQLTPNIVLQNGVIKVKYKTLQYIFHKLKSVSYNRTLGYFGKFYYVLNYF